MALNSIGETDLRSFFTQITTPAGGAAVDTSGSSGHRALVYYDRLDRIYARSRNNGGSVVSWGWMDPLFLDGTMPATNFDHGVSDATTQGFQVGEWDKASGLQHLYATNGSGASDGLSRRDPNTLQLTVSDPFPNFRLAHPTKISTQDGYYLALTLRFAIFETRNEIIIPRANVRYQGADYFSVAVSVDLTTGDATPIDGVFGAANAFPNDFQEPQIQGDDVDWDGIQFLPDDDSTPARPKGRILTHSVDRYGGVPQQTDQRIYYRSQDWNPTGLGGLPSRQHLRILFTSRLEFDETALRGGVGQIYQSGDVILTPIENRISFWVTSSAAADVDQDNINAREVFTPSVAISEITSPAPQRLPVTAATIDFAADVLGSLGEPVSGVGVEFSIEREGTSEDLNTAALPATSPLSVTPDGNMVEVELFLVPLTEGVHWSRSGTTITWLGGHPFFTSGYTANYTHVGNPQTPALGTLLTTVVSSDVNGQARVRVQYPDNDAHVGLADKLTATTL